MPGRASFGDDHRCRTPTVIHARSVRRRGIGEVLTKYLHPLGCR